jgi:hypothetical protein
MSRIDFSWIDAGHSGAGAAALAFDWQSTQIAMNNAKDVGAPCLGGIGLAGISNLIQ